MLLTLARQLAKRTQTQTRSFSSSGGGGGPSLGQKNALVALALVGFVGAVYGSTIYRMKVNDELDD